MKAIIKIYLLGLFLIMGILVLNGCKSNSSNSLDCENECQAAFNQYSSSCMNNCEKRFSGYECIDNSVN